MRTPVHAPSARLSRAAGPMPPRSSARRVLRPLPTPRKRRGEAMAERHSAIDTTTPPFEGRWGAGGLGSPEMEERHGFPGPIRASGGLGAISGPPSKLTAISGPPSRLTARGRHAKTAPIRRPFRPRRTPPDDADVTRTIRARRGRRPSVHGGLQRVSGRASRSPARARAEAARRPRAAARRRPPRAPPGAATHERGDQGRLEGAAGPRRAEEARDRDLRTVL